MLLAATLLFGIVAWQCDGATWQNYTLVISPQPLLNQQFAPQPGPRGWLGGDVDTSTPLDGGALLFLFGDTLVGTSNATQRVAAVAMPHGTVGLLASPDADMQYFWRTGSDGLPAAIFAPTNASNYYWVVNALALKDDIFFLAMLVTKSSGALGFETLGTSGVSVPNGNAVPTAWTYTSKFMPFTSPNLNFFVAMQWAPPSDGHPAGSIYVLGVAGQGFAARQVLGLANYQEFLALDFSNFQVWANGGQWIPIGALVDPADLVTLWSVGATTETTLNFDERLQVWYSFTIAGFASSEILMHTAKSVTGPFNSQVVYAIPPPLNDPKAYFCYAVKSHPALAPTLASMPTLLFSYVCNTEGGLPPLFAPGNLIAYVPRFVEVLFT